MSTTIIAVAKSNVVKTIEQVEITSVKVKPFTDVMVSVVLRDKTGVYIDNRDLNMTNAEYLDWLNDDSYLINWILSKLGLTKV